MSSILPSGAEVPQVLDAIAEQLKPLFVHFLATYVLPSSSSSPAPSSDAATSNKVYVERAQTLWKSGHATLMVDYAHMSEASAQLADAVREHHYRMMPHLCDAVHQFMLQCKPVNMRFSESVKYRPAFYNLPAGSTIRDLKTGRIGELMTISGTVTRTSAVRPELAVGVFICQDCKRKSQPIIQEFKYTEPSHCIGSRTIINTVDKNNAPIQISKDDTGTECLNRTRWTLDTSSDQSVFQNWQLVRIQENSHEIPAGSMPRSMKIVLRHEEVEKAKPGDKCTFTGTLIVLPDVAQLGGGAAGAKFAKSGSNARGARAEAVSGGVTGMKSLGVRDLTYSLCFLASTVSTSTASSASMGEASFDSLGNLRADAEVFTQAETDRILEMKSQGRLYTRMVSSIAPNIFGHDEIKRGILLMLLGGVHKRTADGQNLRGDINVCIVGDPSTSKSQFLKYVCSFLPRAVYTSGKASSAAGLTASVARDVETGEFAIEAGALMLADNGICCIDEFDKMDPADQVAIHEAMEQQTISIAKAGIQATLNARTSILAAANPIKGRYDPSRTLKQNVDISAPIMSRFDLFFVVLDEGDQAVDFNIARHIVNVHTGKASYNRPEFSLSDLQLYIRYARSRKPTISPAAMADFVDNYCQLRGADSTGTNKSAYRITVRQLESMIRLAEARARLDLEDEVTPSHVREAARLLKKSIVHVENRDVDLDGGDLDDEEYIEGGGDNGTDGQDPPPPPSGRAEGQPEESKEDAAAVAMDVDQDGAAPPSADAAAAAASAKLTLSFNEYQRLTLLLVKYLRKHETAETPSMSWSDLVNGFIGSSAGGEVALTEAELVAQTRTVELVIHRLIKVDHILLLLKKSKLKEKRMLKVHPNFTGEAVDQVLLDTVDTAAVAESDKATIEAGEASRHDREDEAMAVFKNMRDQDDEKVRSTPVATPKTPKTPVTPQQAPAGRARAPQTPSSGRSQRSKK